MSLLIATAAFILLRTLQSRVCLLSEWGTESRLHSVAVEQGYFDTTVWRTRSLRKKRTNEWALFSFLLFVSFGLLFFVVK